MAIAPDGYRPSTPEELVEGSRRIRAAFERKPILVPYEVWKPEIDALCRDRVDTLANPVNLTPHSSAATIERLILYQEAFYRAAYADTRFTIDRAKLGLPRERLEDIKAALVHGEVNYPLVTCLPRSLSLEETGLRRRRHPTARIPQVRTSVAAPLTMRTDDDEQLEDPAGSHAHHAEIHSPFTLHRVLFDRLIRQRNITVGERSGPATDEFLEQVRDVTLADLARTDMLSPDGKPIAFNAEHWHLYLRALYRTLPRPVAQAGYMDLSFVRWEQNPPVQRMRTIQEIPKLDAVKLGYPLITSSRYLALFGQYHAATGELLDTYTWSWMFGIVDPDRSPDGPSVSMNGHTKALRLHCGCPEHALSNSRLRFSR
ncbi:hypothetical protein HY634_01775 [Candidatus Uhrbacteria bacterium]|nr:hypothetical protein [Candidatus Uhrbacteria bacterium]